MSRFLSSCEVVKPVEKRQNVRTKFRAQVRVMMEGAEPLELYTRDISDMGVYAFAEPGTLVIGSELSVQVQGMPAEGPTVRMRVVREGHEGFGLEFIFD